MTKPCTELCFAIRHAVQVPTGDMPKHRDAAFTWFKARAEKAIKNASLQTIGSTCRVTVSAVPRDQAISLAFNHVWEG